jgi:hypothetical protein
MSEQPNGSVRLGVQYWLDRMRDEPPLQKFWIRCQFLERSRDTAAAPVPGKTP